MVGGLKRGKTNAWFAVLAACLAGIGSQAAAQDLDTEVSEMMRNRVFDLGEIEVVENYEDGRNKTVDKMYVEQMRLLNRDFLADALNALPGVSPTQLGARNEMMLNVRGFDVKHVPIFQQGIPIYVPLGRLSRPGPFHDLRSFGDRSFQGVHVGAVWSQHHGRGHQHDFQASPGCVRDECGRGLRLRKYTAKGKEPDFLSFRPKGINLEIPHIRSG